MRYVLTQTKSVYEIDADNKRIRRLQGVKDATARQGKDGDWRTYRDISPRADGGLIIVWAVVNNDDGEIVFQTTQTSPVVKESNNIAELVTVN